MSRHGRPATGLPTRPSRLRVRVWRALKATAAGARRKGVYFPPEHASTAQDFRVLERTITDADAEALLLLVCARVDAKDAAFRGLADRSGRARRWPHCGARSNG